MDLQAALLSFAFQREEQRQLLEQREQDRVERLEQERRERERAKRAKVRMQPTETSV